jgi:ferredoxin
MGQLKSGRLSVDRDRCEGYGMCEQAAPQLIHLNQDDEPVLDVAEISPSEFPLAAAAVHACPVAALTFSPTA